MLKTRISRALKSGSCSFLALAALGAPSTQAQTWPDWHPGGSCTSNPACTPVAPVINPAIDYGKPNYANSPPLAKFVDPLPGLCSAGQTTPCIPVATPYVEPTGEHSYDLSIVDYTQRLHRDLPPTALRGYVQTINGQPAAAPTYMGPIIVGQRGTPVRLTVKNAVTPDALPLPIDETIMGAGMGPPVHVAADGSYTYCTVSEAMQPGSSCRTGFFSHDRAVIHLHGGFTPWISDGTPHQWFTPAGDTSIYKKGVSFQNVPGVADIPNTPTDGLGTYYYPNDQSARLMFYHDHTLGITRLNVYAGEAAGYVLTDDVEQKALSKAKPIGWLAAVGLDIGTPLIIQDKSFYNTDKTTGTSVTDPSWTFACGTDETGKGGRVSCSTTPGSLWWPHVYMPNQNIDRTLGGMNPLGRWDYAPLFGPPAFIFNQTLPTVSIVPESFMDTMLVNGKVYPYMEVPQRPMRFRILNASNDRFLNLQLYFAVSGHGKAGVGAGYGKKCSGFTYQSSQCTEVPMVVAHGQSYNVPAYGAIKPAQTVWVPFDNRRGGVPDPRYQVPFIQIGNEAGLLTAPVVHTNQAIDWDYDNKSATAFNVRNYPVSDPERCGGCDFPKPGYTMLLGPAERSDIIIDFGKVPAGSTVILYNDAPAAFPGRDPRYDVYTGSPNQQANGGPLAGAPGYGPNTRTIMQFRVVPSSFALPGSPTVTRTFYSLSPAFMNALPGKLAADYAASHQDSATTPVSGPMTVLDANNQPVAAQPVYYKHTVDPPYFVDVDTYKCNASDQSGCGYLNMCGFGKDCIPGSVDEYPTCAGAEIDQATGRYNNSTSPEYRKTCGFPVRTKTIMEDFEPIYGRLFALLGTEQTALEPNGQNTFGLRYSDPATEALREGETEIWNVWHNGVDTHAVHFHLMNVQVINRIDWGGVVKLPEPSEKGFKETVLMNPLENVVLAVRVNKPKLPSYWGALPSSKRPRDVTTALDVTNPGQAIFPFLTVGASNQIEDFGWEYVWHCHLLGHEENDMMRPLVMKDVQ